MKKAHFSLRALIWFVVFLALGAGILRFSTHHYKNVADWERPDSVEVLVYEEDTFYLAGKVGDNGISAKKFPQNEILGEVTPKSIFDATSPLIIWSVEEKEEYLIVVDEEKNQWLYYKEGAENPVAPETETAS